MPWRLAAGQPLAANAFLLAAKQPCPGADVRQRPNSPSSSSIAHHTYTEACVAARNLPTPPRARLHPPSRAFVPAGGKGWHAFSCAGSASIARGVAAPVQTFACPAVRLKHNLFSRRSGALRAAFMLRLAAASAFFSRDMPRPHRGGTRAALRAALQALPATPTASPSAGVWRK